MHSPAKSVEMASYFPRLVGFIYLISLSHFWSRYNSGRPRPVVTAGDDRIFGTEIHRRKTFWSGRPSGSEDNLWLIQFFKRTENNAARKHHLCHMMTLIMLTQYFILLSMLLHRGIVSAQFHNPTEHRIEIKCQMQEFFFKWCQLFKFRMQMASC